MAKTQKDKSPAYTTVRVTSDTNKKLAKAVAKYNDRHPDNTLNKTEYLSLLFDYCHQFGIDVDDTEKPLTEMRKLRSSVKSFNDSAWASKKETEKFVQEQNARTNKMIATEQEVCDTLAGLIADKDFNEQVLRPLRDRLDNLCDLTAIKLKDKKGNVNIFSLSKSLYTILETTDSIRRFLSIRSNDPKAPTILDRLIHIETMLSTMKMKGRLYGWEDIK